MSSPAVVLAASSIVALAWAFQQQGWSFCIPGVVLAARKIASLRWKYLAALVPPAGGVAHGGAGLLVRLAIRLAPR